MILLIDFHAHILPGADHGSDSLKASLKQVMAAKKAGVTSIIATPHFYMNSDNISDFILRRDKTYDELSEALKVNNINVEIIKGCEVNLQVDLFNLDNLKPLCIDGTNYMLLEMPMNINWTKWHYDAIDELISRGIQPIIAHINRYSSYYTERLFNKDLLYQVNIEAFNSFSSRRKINRLFKDGYIHFIGSDIHGSNIGLYDSMKLYNEKYSNMFRAFELNSIKVLNERKNNAMTLLS